VFQTLLFVSGISTLLQSLFGTRLPIVLVGSHTYIIPITSIIQARRYSSETDSYEVSDTIFSYMLDSITFSVSDSDLAYA